VGKLDGTPEVLRGCPGGVPRRQPSVSIQGPIRFQRVKILCHTPRSNEDLVVLLQNLSKGTASFNAFRASIMSKLALPFDSDDHRWHPVAARQSLPRYTSRNIGLSLACPHDTPDAPRLKDRRFLWLPRIRYH
jgi:hypothetical protein